MCHRRPFKRNSVNAFRLTGSTTLVSMGLKLLREALLGSFSFSGTLAPYLPVSKQSSDWRPTPPLDDATFLNPAADSVFGVQVFSGCIAHCGRRLKAVALPLQAALYRPRQDARELCAQLLAQPQVAVNLWNSDGERYEVEAPANGFIDRSEPRLVIARDD